MKPVIYAFGFIWLLGMLVLLLKPLFVAIVTIYALERLGILRFPEVQP
jgi:hypothetical protein